ncbi:MAG: polysaccharide biosynthesis tyrosine autokinase, partial [Anaerolineae bacterium]|nr:polysaccharide biosynthesis tyrosine autokinase [Anaerolineae bacterium]
PALVPTSPALPRTRTNVMLAAVVGAMLAVGVAFLVEYLDDTVKDADDVGRIAALPTFATILRFRQSQEPANAPVMATEPSSAVAEAYRILRTNLDFATLAVRNSPATILVTSAQPLEGKTTTLANLGVALAQVGKRVVLVDTDLRRPALHRHFGLPNDFGLTSLLLQRDAEPGDALQATSIEGLYVLTSGPLPSNPAEVLAYAQTGSLLEQLSSVADYVLLDSPPILSVADASILARKADGVVLVAEAGRTRSDVFRRGVEALLAVKANILGVVLNKLSARPGSYYYHYYYYYDEGGDGERTARRRLGARAAAA